MKNVNFGKKSIVSEKVTSYISDPTEQTRVKTDITIAKWPEIKKFLFTVNRRIIIIVNYLFIFYRLNKNKYKIKTQIPCSSSSIIFETSDLVMAWLASNHISIKGTKNY